jgi:hypothetical protein
MARNILKEKDGKYIGNFDPSISHVAFKDPEPKMDLWE